MILAASGGHTVATPKDSTEEIPSEIAEILRKLVDGRRLELPTSALRTRSANPAKLVSGEGLSPRGRGVCSAQETAELRGFLHSVARRTSTKCVTRADADDARSAYQGRHE